MKTTQHLRELGQSLWLDSISRPMLDDGRIERYVNELGVTGLTSNPTIFDEAISTGAYGYPVSEAAPVALSATLEALGSTQHVRLCRFVLFDISTVRAFERAAENLSKTNSSIHIEKANS